MTINTTTTTRPDGVTLTAIWFLVGAVFALLGTAAMLLFAFPAVLDEPTSGIDRYLPVAALSFALFVIVILGLADLVAAIGLLRLRPWGRILAFVLSAMGLLAFPVGTVVGALIIWYLLTDEAKQAFGGETPPASSSAELEQMVP